MRGADTHAGVPVEVLVERDEVVPRWIVLKPLVPTEDGPAAVAVEEDPDQAASDLVGDLIERHHLSGPGRALDLELLTEIAVVDPQRLYQQVVDGHPDRPSPVRVAAEQPRARLGRLVHQPPHVSPAVDYQRGGPGP